MTLGPSLGKPRKKVIFLMAGSLRGGGKGPAITKKITFHELFTNLLKYGHITLKFIQKLGVEKNFNIRFRLCYD